MPLKKGLHNSIHAPPGTIDTGSFLSNDKENDKASSGSHDQRTSSNGSDSSPTVVFDSNSATSPTSSTSDTNMDNTGGHGNAFNPTNTSAFVARSTSHTPSLFTPASTAFSSSPADSSDQTSTERIYKSNDDRTRDASPASSSSSGRYSLRLKPAILVGASSMLPGFSIDGFLMQRPGEGESFSCYILAAGISQGCSIEALGLYLDAFPRIFVEQHINDLVKGQHPVMFYVAKRNSVECVRLLLDHGCDAKVCDADGVPCLAYAIMRSKATVQNPVDVVKMLITFGANPRTILSDIWERCIKALLTSALEGSLPDTDSSWCTLYYRKMLAATLNLSIRYFLLKASQLTVAKGRGLQIAKALKYTPLLKVLYLIIG